MVHKNHNWSNPLEQLLSWNEFMKYCKHKKARLASEKSRCDSSW